MLQLHREPIRPGSDVKGGGDTKQLKEHTETHTRPAFEKTADGEREKERHEKIRIVTAALCVSDRVVNIGATITARCCLGQVWLRRAERT